MKKRLGYALVGLWVLALGNAGIAPGQFGELPPGAVSSSEMDKTGEIVLWLVFDPALVRDQLPEGLRFQTLAEIAARRSAVAEYLRSHPEHRSWVRSYFEVIGTEGMRIDGRAAEFGPRGGLAVWYVGVVRTDASDPRPRGGHSLALGTWLSDHRLGESMRAKGYPWEGAEVEYWRDDQGTVRGRLKTTGLEIEGTCRPQGAPQKDDYPELPYYLTVWSPRPYPKTYEIATVYGHMFQRCSGEWKVEGDHPLVRAFRSRAVDGEGISSTEYAFGYFLRGALYSRQ